MSLSNIMIILYAYQVKMYNIYAPSWRSSVHISRIKYVRLY
jgi:hypothetical protein